MTALKHQSEWGMVANRPEAQNNPKFSPNSNDSTASRELDERSLGDALDQGLENAASNSATPTDDDISREVLDKGLTDATAAKADYQRQAEEKRRRKIRIKNRRRMYLNSHPEYFADPDLELEGKSRLIPLPFLPALLFCG